MLVTSTSHPFTKHSRERKRPSLIFLAVLTLGAMTQPMRMTVSFNKVHEKFHLRQSSTEEATHCYNPPCGSHVRECGGDEQSKLVRLALPSKLPSNSTELLSDKQAAKTLHHDEARTAPTEKEAPPT